MGQWTHGLTGALVVVALSAGAATLNAQQNARTTTNGLERTPVLGWSSWSFLRKDATAANMGAQAVALQKSGLQKLGYQIHKPRRFLVPVSGSAGPERGF